MPPRLYRQLELADAARRAFAVEASDHLTTVNALSTWRRIRHEHGRNFERQWCRKHFLSLETLETIEAELGGVWVSDFDIEWTPQSYAANQHLPAAKGKDYSLIKADTQAMQPVSFSGPLPHLVTPWAASGHEAVLP